MAFKRNTLCKKTKTDSWQRDAVVINSVNTLKLSITRGGGDKEGQREGQEKHTFQLDRRKKTTRLYKLHSLSGIDSRLPRIEHYRFIVKFPNDKSRKRCRSLRQRNSGTSENWLFFFVFFFAFVLFVCLFFFNLDQI